jgi:hypothetical protein
MTQDEKYTDQFKKGLNEYIELGFNQDECNGFMHGFHKGAEAKQLILSGVSHSKNLNLIQTIENTKQLPQVQYDLQRQLRELRVMANKLGLYDAADFLSGRSEQLCSCSSKILSNGNIQFSLCRKCQEEMNYE